MTTLTQPIEKPSTPIHAVPALKRILVHIDRSDASHARVLTAVNLARLFHGKLAGVYAIRPIIPLAASGELPAAFLVEQERLAEEDADIAKRRYLDHVTRSGLQSDWYSVRGDAVAEVRRIARYMDLSVVGQIDPGRPEPEIVIRPEEIALGSGRPVLVIPYIGTPVEVGSRIVVAWDGGRESARAVADALPLLRQARSVWVVSIDVKDRALREGSSAAKDLCLFLGDHGITAEPQELQAGTLSGSDALLSRLSDLGADLLVMGCYGHSRLREFVLGGMTRGILQHMTVPVLLSH